MDSIVHKSEIVESKASKVSNKYLEDDINRLFEAINLRTSKSLDFSDRARRDPSKRPMRSSVSNSPGIGFSEPVSLKQALRGMCISQASEMAAARRSSKLPGSPSISEQGEILSRVPNSSRFSSKIPLNLHSSGSRSLSHSTQSSPRFTLPRQVPESKVKSPSQSVLSSPRFFGKSISKITASVVPEESISGSFDPPEQIRDPEIESSEKESKCPGSNISTASIAVDIQPLEVVEVEAEDQDSVPSVTSHNSAPRKVTVKAHKATPKQRRRGIPVSNSATRSTARAVKPTTRNRKPPRTKPNTQESTQAPESSNLSGEVICQRCQCALKETKNDSIRNLVTPAPAKNKNSKSREVDFSQSSKSSSIGDYSSSTTTISEGSNISRCVSDTRPHMSKDTRWEAINSVKKQHGFLGLGHFDLLKKLGCGDIGTVYLAELIGTNCLYAIKVMDNEYLARRNKTLRAQTEREILGILDHPFLPTLYTQFTSDNLSCLVMEFCPGGDLHVLRQRQPGRYFPEPAARFYVAEVLLALEYLHMLGVVYRDLKPENIMVREDGHIMLTDFDLSLRCSVNPTLSRLSSSALEPARISGPCAGSSCIDPFCSSPSCKVSCFTPINRKPKPKTESLSSPQIVVEPTEARSNSFVGTHEYLAPEIIKGDGHGSAVDWWTLGVFLYELLYGKTPFKGVGNEETLNNVVMQHLRFPESPIVSFQARDLIRGLLVKEPESRLGSKTGAAEIKRHPFFDGLNWALIRCATPPQVPEFEAANSVLNEKSNNNNLIEYGSTEFVMF